MLGWKMTRRRFLSWLTWCGLALSGLLSGLGSLRYLLPTISYGSPLTFKIGKPELYPLGSKKFLREPRIFIIHERDGFRAMSAACTHLGCAVNAVDWGYSCPCHGSKFDNLGINFSGPAPKPLPWYKIYLAPDGELVVDMGRTVPWGTIFEPG
ncbi:MAG: ubiquinol-cytochrome c reductase iron-sulfur subunit [Anaerolineae bacterium]